MASATVTIRTGNDGSHSYSKKDDVSAAGLGEKNKFAAVSPGMTQYDAGHVTAAPNDEKEDDPGPDALAGADDKWGSAVEDAKERQLFLYYCDDGTEAALARERAIQEELEREERILNNALDPTLLTMLTAIHPSVEETRGRYVIEEEEHQQRRYLAAKMASLCQRHGLVLSTVARKLIAPPRPKAFTAPPEKVPLDIDIYNPDGAPPALLLDRVCYREEHHNPSLVGSYIKYNIYHNDAAYDGPVEEARKRASAVAATEYIDNRRELVRILRQKEHLEMLQREVARGIAQRRQDILDKKANDKASAYPGGLPAILAQREVRQNAEAQGAITSACQIADDVIASALNQQTDANVVACLDTRAFTSSDVAAAITTPSLAARQDKEANSCTDCPHGGVVVVTTRNAVDGRGTTSKYVISSGGDPITLATTTTEVINDHDALLAGHGLDDGQEVTTTTIVTDNRRPLKYSVTDDSPDGVGPIRYPPAMPPMRTITTTTTSKTTADPETRQIVTTVTSETTSVEEGPSYAMLLADAHASGAPSLLTQQVPTIPARPLPDYPKDDEGLRQLKQNVSYTSSLNIVAGMAGNTPTKFETVKNAEREICGDGERCMIEFGFPSHTDTMMAKQMAPDSDEVETEEMKHLREEKEALEAQAARFKIPTTLSDLNNRVSAYTLAIGRAALGELQSPADLQQHVNKLMTDAAVKRSKEEAEMKKLAPRLPAAITGAQLLRAVRATRKQMQAEQAKSRYNIGDDMAALATAVMREKAKKRRKKDGEEAASGEDDEGEEREEGEESNENYDPLTQRNLRTHDGVNPKKDPHAPRPDSASTCHTSNVSSRASTPDPYFSYRAQSIAPGVSNRSSVAVGGLTGATDSMVGELMGVDGELGRLIMPRGLTKAQKARLRDEQNALLYHALLAQLLHNTYLAVDDGHSGADSRLSDSAGTTEQHMAAVLRLLINTNFDLEDRENDDNEVARALNDKNRMMKNAGQEPLQTAAFQVPVQEGAAQSAVSARAPIEVPVMSRNLERRLYTAPEHVNDNATASADGEEDTAAPEDPFSIRSKPIVAAPVKGHARNRITVADKVRLERAERLDLCYQCAIATDPTYVPLRGTDQLSEPQDPYLREEAKIKAALAQRTVEEQKKLKDQAVVQLKLLHGMATGAPVLPEHAQSVEELKLLSPVTRGTLERRLKAVAEATIGNEASPDPKVAATPAKPPLELRGTSQNRVLCVTDDGTDPKAAALTGEAARAAAASATAAAAALISVSKSDLKANASIDKIAASDPDMPAAMPAQPSPPRRFSVAARGSIAGTTDDLSTVRSRASIASIGATTPGQSPFPGDNAFAQRVKSMREQDGEKRATSARATVVIKTADDTPEKQVQRTVAIGEPEDPAPTESTQDTSAEAGAAAVPDTMDAPGPEPTVFEALADNELSTQVPTEAQASLAAGTTVTTRPHLSAPTYFLRIHNPLQSIIDAANEDDPGARHKESDQKLKNDLEEQPEGLVAKSNADDMPAAIVGASPMRNGTKTVSGGLILGFQPTDDLDGSEAMAAWRADAPARRMYRMLREVLAEAPIEALVEVLERAERQAHRTRSKVERIERAREAWLQRRAKVRQEREAKVEAALMKGEKPPPMTATERAAQDEEFDYEREAGDYEGSDGEHENEIGKDELAALGHGAYSVKVRRYTRPTRTRKEDAIMARDDGDKELKDEGGLDLDGMTSMQRLYVSNPMLYSLVTKLHRLEAQRRHYLEIVENYRRRVVLASYLVNMEGPGPKDEPVEAARTEATSRKENEIKLRNAAAVAQPLCGLMSASVDESLDLSSTALPHAKVLPPTMPLREREQLNAIDEQQERERRAQEEAAIRRAAAAASNNPYWAAMLLHSEQRQRQVIFVQQTAARNALLRSFTIGSGSEYVPQFRNVEALEDVLEAEDAAWREAAMDTGDVDGANKPHKTTNRLLPPAKTGQQLVAEGAFFGRNQRPIAAAPPAKYRPDGTARSYLRTTGCPTRTYTGAEADAPSPLASRPLRSAPSGQVAGEGDDKADAFVYLIKYFKQKELMNRRFVIQAEADGWDEITAAARAARLVTKKGVYSGFYIFGDQTK